VVATADVVAFEDGKLAVIPIRFSAAAKAGSAPIAIRVMTMPANATRRVPPKRAVALESAE
jgi:hypothetical protein